MPSDCECRVLSRHKESRKRHVTFHIPASISCSANLRLLQNDSSYISLGDIFDKFCEDTRMAREDPILIPGEKVKETLRKFREMHFRMVSCVACLCVGSY